MNGRVALDFDSVLAETWSVAFDLICGPDNDYEMSDVEDWDWGFRQFGKEKTLSALWHAWTIRPMDVPPLEEGLQDTVASLRRVWDVDIVTAHPDHMGISKGKKRWLEKQNIAYDDFIVAEPGGTKATMGYNVYIDDKPALPAQVDEHSPESQVYLRDQPYNRGVEGDYIRVNSVEEALNHLVWGTTEPHEIVKP